MINTILNSTFVDNSASEGAGIRNHLGTINNLRNTLFNKNIFSNNDCQNSGGGSINGNNNLSNKPTSDCPNVSTTLTSTTIGLLADNGGPTMTHALLPGSEAIDAGNGDSTTTDQHGFAANGTRDIGAFETQPVELCPLALQTDGFTTSVANSAELNQAIECANINGNGSDTINLSADITLTSGFEEDVTYGSTGTAAISSPIILDGMGYNIMRDGGLSCNLNNANATSEFRIIRIESTGDLTLNNITLNNGCADGGNVFKKSGGAIYNEGGLSLSNSTLSENSSGSSGGGIYNNGTIANIQNSTLSGNSTQAGGGLYNDSHITTIQNSTFSGNSSTAIAGGIYNNDNSTISTIQNSTFSGNSAILNDGGIQSVGTIAALNNSLFHQNTGGGIECSGIISGSNNLSDNAASGCPDVSLLTISVGSLADNGGPTMTHALLPGSEAIDNAVAGTATGQRGFAANGTRDIGAFEAQADEYCQDPLLQVDSFITSVANPSELNQAIICANLNGNGADTINLSSDITLTAAFETNSLGSTGTPAIISPIILDGMGFAIVRDGNCNFNGTNGSNEYRILRVGTSGNLTLKNMTLSNGCADGSGIRNAGGAILSRSFLSVENSTFSGNFASRGAGIYNDQILTLIKDSTFSGNIAPSFGGGLGNSGTITTIQNSTFSANSSSVGGGVYNNGVIDTLRNSLFHLNTGNAVCSNTINGSNNLSDNANSDCPDVLTTLTAGTVGPLANNGGPTMTHALLPGSEAIDAGNGDSIATDQRGYTATNTRDIGAFESFVPVVIAPMDISVEATGQLTSPALGVAGVSDVDETGLVAIASPADNFALGMTTVTWTSTDSYGFIGTDSQIVTVVDTTDPLVTTPSDISIEATGPLTPVKLGTATAIDLVDGALMPTADNSGPFPVGETIVIWSVTDANNNTGQATQTVTITDNTAPEITLIGDNLQIIQETEDYIELGATVADLVDDDMALTAAIVIDDSDVNTDIPGIYEVTYNVMDTAGNEADTVTRTIEVTADIPVANNDSYNTNEDTVLNSKGSVLTNDNDPDNDGLTVVTTGVSTMTGLGGSINILANGTFTYTPVADAVGTDVLNYEVTDGTHTVSSTITIEVNPVNDAPTFNVMGDVDVTGLVDVINDFVEVPDFIENIVFGPTDESGQSIDSITANEIDPDNVINAVSIDINGLLRIDINIGNYGAAIVEVQLKDDGGTANGGEDTSSIVDFMVIYDDLIFGNGFEDNTESR